MSQSSWKTTHPQSLNDIDPAFLALFEDHSWHQNTQPCFYREIDEQTCYLLWIAYEKASEKEDPTECRFSLSIVNRDNNTYCMSTAHDGECIYLENDFEGLQTLCLTELGLTPINKEPEQEPASDIGTNNIELAPKVFSSIQVTSYKLQLGVNIHINSDKLTSFLSVFSDGVETDNITIKVLHGDSEDELINTSVPVGECINPTISYSDDKSYCYVKFVTSEVHIKLTEEGIIIDLWDSNDSENGSVDTSYLYDNEFFDTDE